MTILKTDTSKFMYNWHWGHMWHHILIFSRVPRVYMRIYVRIIL